jgi:hypothetical protein
MEQSKQFSQHQRRIAFRVVIALSVILVYQSKFGFAAQTGYESIPVLSASKILPPELLTGQPPRSGARDQ